MTNQCCVCRSAQIASIHAGLRGPGQPWGNTPREHATASLRCFVHTIVDITGAFRAAAGRVTRSLKNRVNSTEVSYGW